MNFELSLEGKQEQMRWEWTAGSGYSKSDFHAKGECGKYMEVPIVCVDFGHLLGAGCREKLGWGYRQGLQYPERLLPSVLMSLGFTILGSEETLKGCEQRSKT